ncbi:hypothetical protein PENSPDRAFT_760069 [Peniophora sp. CONT]|nr:hypothetical protein PENSPDRAFT_760069 [Peniophora sp. CONT]
MNPLESEAHKYWATAAGPRIAALCTSIRDDLPPAEMEARRQALAAESSAMRSFLWRFETSLNNLQPIMRLPTEILTTIFMLVAESNPITGYPQNRRTYSYLGTRSINPYVDWLPLTRVCRRWRAEALACSPLWGRIPLSLGTKGIDEFVRRSRDASLVIDCAHHDRYQHLGEMLQPGFLARARELHVPTTALQGNNAATYLPLLQNPAPRLEAFVIRGGFAGAILRRRAAIKLPDNLFENNAPLLRTLQANQVDRFPTQRSLFSNLRTFSVANPNSHSGYIYPTRLEMYDVLRSMPLLESLSLTNSMAREGSGVDAVPFDLPRLSELTLNGPVDGCASVLQPLRVKPRCKITISTTDELAAVRDKSQGLFGNLGRTGFNVNFAPRTLVITILDGRLNVTAFDDPVTDLRSLTNRVLSSPGNSQFTLTIGFRRRAAAGASHMTRCVQELFARALPVHGVEQASVLAMAGTSDTSARQLFDPLWKTAFAPCTRLSGLYVAGPAAYVLLRALSEPLAQPVLPALSNLIFDDNQISRVRLFEHIPLYNIVLQALSTRDIPKLQIPESPLLTQADMDTLRLHTNLSTFARAPHGPGGWLDQDVMPILVDGGIGGVAGMHDWVGPGDAMQHILEIEDEDDSEDDLDGFEVLPVPGPPGMEPFAMPVVDFQVQ